MQHISFIRPFVLMYCVLACAYVSLAQSTIQPYMRWITEEDGLPSNEVYHVIQDDKGFMWFASDDGIVKYDGKNMEVFNKSHGLPENVVFRLYKRESGKIIGECLSNKYFTLLNNKITPFKINDSITKHLGSANISSSYTQDKKGNHHFGTRYGIYVLNSHGNLLNSTQTLLSLGSKDSVISGVLLSKIDNKWISARQSILKSQEKSKSNFLLEFLNPGRSFLANIPNDLLDNWGGNSVHIIEIENDKLCFNYGNGIFLTGKNGIIQIKNFHSPTLDLFFHGGYLYVCTLYKGVYQLKLEGNELKEVSHFLDGFSVTSGTRSIDGSFWFTTREGGVVHIPNSNLNIINKVSDDNISALLIEPNVKLIGTEKGLVYFNDKLIQKATHTIKGFLKLNDGSYISLSKFTEPIVFNSNQDRIKWNKFDAQNHFFQINNGVIINDRLAGIGPAVFILYDLNKNSFIYQGRWGRENKKEKIFSILNLEEDIYLGAANGLFKLDSNTGEIVKQYTSNEVRCIQKFRDGLLGFSQTGQVYYVKGNQLQTLELPKFKMINRYYTFLVEDNLLVASNNLGVYKWNISDRMEFTLQDFTPLPRVNFIKSSGNYWYYATKKMVLTENKNAVEQVKPKLLLSSILINGSKIKFEHENEFDNQSNNIQFNLRTIDFVSKFAYYKYKLDNHDPEYILGSSNVINYSALIPGTYTFKISVTTDGFRYSDELKYTFTIHPPFWKTTWFIILSLGIFLVILFTFIYFRIKRYREKYRIEKMITTLRSQALTTQLNPHLIFNILNSIQGMVSEGEIENVNTYIAKFSKFMRLTLNLSKRETVSISEEIENTIQYTELEKLRFIDSVQFEFLIDVKNKELQVPPMIIQPLIENAIKHGVMPKMMSQGKIIIRVQEQENKLLIQVEDNGLGFQSASASFGDGLRITSERLKVISPLNDLQVINYINPTIIQISYTK